MKHRFATFVILVVLLSSVAGGWLSGSAAADPGQARTSPNEFLANFTEALNLIEQHYVDSIGPDQLVYSAIKGMLRALDPHSSFFDPKEFNRLREEQVSKYYGLGIRVRPLFRDRGRVVIVEPPSIGSPAERRGLRAGDVITRIEGRSIDDWTSDEVVGNLRGPRGTFVNITVERPGLRNPLQFRVERDEIPIVTVPYAFLVRPGIGYIKVDRFAESTADELRQKMGKIEADKLDGLVLDLRDNPGGLLNQAIDIADIFLPRGKMIVSTRGRAQGSVRPYPAPSGEKMRVPLVVLINRHSASASEIVAGSLQDHDRALIVGETSFGKGLVQSVYTLEGGTGMALTTAKYYTPSGRLIQRDYSGSSFDYYYASNTAGAGEEPREITYTDAGRKVYGGGGITPDYVIPMREFNRFEALLTSKDILFEFARRLVSGQVQAARDFKPPLKKESDAAASAAAAALEITPAILVEFQEYLRERRVEFTEQDIHDNIEFIKRRIKQEVNIAAFGLQEGYRVAIQGDNQVLKAIELLPEARQLMTTGQAQPNEKKPD